MLADGLEVYAQEIGASTIQVQEVLDRLRGLRVTTHTGAQARAMLAGLVAEK